jgi:anti-sigma factor (TIGR02949 family)
MTSAPTTHGHCGDLLERLSRYIDGELPQADREVIEQHLHGCPECEQVLHSLEHTKDLCRAEGRPELPPEVRRRALARVHELLSRPRARAHRRHG